MPVPELVRRVEDRLRVGLRVARRQADVVDRDRRRERVHGRVEPPGLRRVAEPLEDLPPDHLLLLDGEVPVSEVRRHGLGGLDLADQRDHDLLDPLEDRRDLLAAGALLVVVEEDVVVRLAHVLEALEVAVLQLHVLLQVGKESLEVGVAPGLGPRHDAQDLCLRELRLELGRDAARLLPVAPGHADERGVDRFRVELGLVLGELVEELARLVRDEQLVREPIDRRQLVGAGVVARGRHHRLLVPADQRAHAPQIENRPNSFLELVQRGFVTHCEVSAPSV